MAEPIKRSSVVRSSYMFLIGVLLCVGWFKIQTTFITVLFSYFALSAFAYFSVKVLKSKNGRLFSISLFIIGVCAIFYAFVFFVNEAVTALPDIASRSIPIALDYAKKYNLNLPFNDLEGLKAVAAKAVSQGMKDVAKFAELATKEFVFLILGLVIAISIFINSKLDLGEGHYSITNNLYSLLCKEISARFYNFYYSFETVMGAQIIISTINTILTSIFILLVNLPYPKIVVPSTFLCGLLPIVGNLISNTIITCIAVTTSLQMAVLALLYLIVLHKFEYFLNSKIIGGRIKNPMWLTLLSLIVGERIMGIPGMILAPVILHYVKHEASQAAAET